MSVDKLHCFPRDDPSFRAYAEALLTASASDDPRELQQHLRRSYPRAVVTMQHRLATLTDGPAIWYVYRDGHYVTPADEEMAAPVDAA
jgi:hypothetical protein